MISMQYERNIHDSLFNSLQLWFDGNHNGFSEPDELEFLSDYFESIDLDYKEQGRVDQWGNEFRYKTKFHKLGHGVSQAYDVFLVVE